MGVMRRERRKRTEIGRIENLTAQRLTFSSRGYRFGGQVAGFRRGMARGFGMEAPVIGAVVLLAGVVAWLARSRQAAVRRAEAAEAEAGRLRAEKRVAEVRAVKEARRKRG